MKSDFKTTIKRIGICIAVILLCASFFTFLYMHWKLSFGLMFAACAVGVFCGEDDFR